MISSRDIPISKITEGEKYERERSGRRSDVEIILEASVEKEGKKWMLLEARQYRFFSVKHLNVVSPSASTY